MGKILREKKDSGHSSITKTTANSKRVQQDISLDCLPPLELSDRSPSVDSKPNNEISLESQTRDDLLNIVPGIDSKDLESERIVSKAMKEVVIVSKERDFCLNTPLTSRSLARGLTESKFQEMEVDDPETPDAPRAPKIKPTEKLVPIHVAPLLFEMDDEDSFLKRAN